MLERTYLKPLKERRNGKDLCDRTGICHRTYEQRYLVPEGGYSAIMFVERRKVFVLEQKAG